MAGLDQDTTFHNLNVIPLVRQLGQLDNIADQWALQDQLLLHIMLKGLFALVLSENPQKNNVEVQAAV
jgi:hypothetical protein